MSRVNHVLTQLAPVTLLLVLCLVFFNKKSVTKRKSALQEGEVASEMVDSSYLPESIVSRWVWRRLERTSNSHGFEVRKNRCARAHVLPGVVLRLWGSASSLGRLLDGEVGGKSNSAHFLVYARLHCRLAGSRGICLSSRDWKMNSRLVWRLEPNHKSRATAEAQGSSLSRSRLPERRMAAASTLRLCLRAILSRPAAASCWWRVVGTPWLVPEDDV